MKVLISGAGVAGLTVAYWLKRYGYTPTVVERSPQLLKGGYKIDARGSAIKVLRQMGIYEDIVAASTDMQGAILVNKNGKVINKMGGDAFGHRIGEDVEIVRGALCQILMDLIPDVEFIFGDSIQEIHQFPDHVQVEFQHHQSREFDLIIGADGLHSNVRRLIFGDESQFSHKLGLYLSVFTVPNYLNLDRIEMQYTASGRVATLWSTRGDHNAKACFGFTCQTDIDLDDIVQQQTTLKTVYEGIGWEIPRLLQMMPESTDFYFDAATQICMEHWSKNRVVLLGDAAYCASPLSGQGTSLALIGAYVLAGELASARQSYQIAFDQYEKQLQPFVMRNQQLGITAANRMKLLEKNNLFTWPLKQLMRIFPGRLIQFFINLSTWRIKKVANSIKLKEY